MAVSISPAPQEKLCYMAFDFGEEARLARETSCTTESYALPDGRVIRLGAERFTAPEALMNPRWARARPRPCLWGMAGAASTGMGAGQLKGRHRRAGGLAGADAGCPGQGRARRSHVHRGGRGGWGGGAAGAVRTAGYAQSNTPPSHCCRPARLAAGVRVCLPCPSPSVLTLLSKETAH